MFLNDVENHIHGCLVSVQLLTCVKIRMCVFDCYCLFEFGTVHTSVQFCTYPIELGTLHICTFTFGTVYWVQIETCHILSGLFALLFVANPLQGSATLGTALCSRSTGDLLQVRSIALGE